MEGDCRIKKGKERIRTGRGKEEMEEDDKVAKGKRKNRIEEEGESGRQKLNEEVPWRWKEIKVPAIRSL